MGSITLIAPLYFVLDTFATRTGQHVARVQSITRRHRKQVWREGDREEQRSHKQTDRGESPRPSPEVQRRDDSTPICARWTRAGPVTAGGPCRHNRAADGPADGTVAESPPEH